MPEKTLKNPEYGQHLDLLACVWFKSTDTILKSKSLPWVIVDTMSPCIYYGSLSIPWVHVYTMSPCQYHDSLPITWVLVYTMRPGIQITEIQKYKLNNNRNTNTEMQKYNLQQYRNKNYRKKTEIQITGIQKYIFQKHKNTN